MILGHYKLLRQPFGVTPDPRFLYMSSTHREAMASLVHGILSGRGFTALIAEPGMGKTTLLFNLLHMLKKIAKTAFLFQTLCGPREFLRALLADLGIEDYGRDFTEMHAKLNEYLLRQSEQGRQVVVIIDEAQNLDEDVLEVVRMLSNFETANKKLMHIVLAGQSQLAEKLETGNLIQLRQRISIVARLAPFDADETREYIEHRLKLAGFAFTEPLFTGHAYAKIAEHSRGIPRDINNLCFNAMSLGCALKRRTVDALMVQETIDDLNLKTLAHSPGKPKERAVEGRRAHLPSSESGLFPFIKWRVTAVVAGSFLLLLCWPAYRAGLFALKQLSPERTRSTSQQSPMELGVVPLEELPIRVQPDQSLSTSSMMYGGRHDKQIATDILRLNQWLKDPRRMQSGQIVRIPLRHRAAAQMQSAPEQNAVPLEFAAEGEKR